MSRSRQAESPVRDKAVAKKNCLQTKTVFYIKDFIYFPERIVITKFIRNSFIRNSYHE
jgi:hypothetical protein